MVQHEAAVIDFDRQQRHFSVARRLGLADANYPLKALSPGSGPSHQLLGVWPCLLEGFPAGPITFCEPLRDYSYVGNSSFVRLRLGAVLADDAAVMSAVELPASLALPDRRITANATLHRGLQLRPFHVPRGRLLVGVSGAEEG